MNAQDEMTYLPPSVVLSQLSEFTSKTVLGAIGDDSKYIRSQVGSMSSTLSFLSKEVDRRDESIFEQRNALLDALYDLDELGDSDASEWATNRREAVEAVDPILGNVNAVQDVLLESLSDLQVAVSDGTFGEDEPEAREILYDLFETRIESQLWVLGREE